MLRILDDLNKVNRFTLGATDGLLASGVTGTWAAASEGSLDLPSAGDLNVFQIFSESYRDGTAGKWAPDVTASGSNKLTAIAGKYRALTDQYAGTPSVGDYLDVDTAGKLAAGTKGDGDGVAVCTKAPHSISHLGNSYTVIEFVTI